MGDEAAGGVDDILCRAVVLLELECHQLGPYTPHLQYVAYIGAAERVYALSVVAHHTQLAYAAGELRHDHVLGKVGVLKLIDQHVAEVLAVVAEHLGPVAQQA